MTELADALSSRVAGAQQSHNDTWPEEGCDHWSPQEPESKRCRTSGVDDAADSSHVSKDYVVVEKVLEVPRAQAVEEVVEKIVGIQLVQTVEKIVVKTVYVDAPTNSREIADVIIEG